MKEVTAILLILIALIGIISIIIVKLFYKDKEKDDEKEKLEEFINSTKADYDNERRKRVRKTRNRGEYTQAQYYANTIDSKSDRIKVGDLSEDEDYVETGKVGGTTALLRQRAKAMEEAPKKQPRRVRRPKAEPATKKVPRTPERVKTQMEKEEEVKPFQEPIKPEHTATINSARQEEKQPVARQVPMTEKQKEFISSDSNKLVVEEGEGTVKVVKSVKPTDTIEEIKESAKIEDESASPKEEEIAEKAETETAKLVEEIEEAKEGAEETIVEAKEEIAETKETIKETAKEEIAETKETIKETAKEEIAETKEETPKIESTIEKIKQASQEKEEAKETVEEKPQKTTETKTEQKEEKPPKTTKTKTEQKEEKPPKTTETKTEEIRPTPNEVPVEETESDNRYHDDLHLLLNKDEMTKEEDESPENDFVTINSDDEVPSTGNELINSAIKSIRNFRKANVPEKPVVVETKDDIVPDDYAQDLGDGIEYIGDTITITPIHEEERDLANNQPNEDVDKVYKEINKESYNKTDDEELDESFKDVTDETSEKDANVYTKEDYEKIEKQEAEKKRRAENTKKILGSKGISEEELRQRSEAKAKSKRARKTAPAEEPVEEGQKRLMMHQARTDVEEVYINGTLFELKVGQIVMFDIKGETYSSQILKLKPGYIGVRYRSKKIWVKSNSVKKILK